MEEEIKRWTARRKSALVLEIIQGKTTVAEASRQFDLTPSEIEGWVDEGKRGMENALRAKPEGRAGAVRATAQGPAGSLRRGHAGAARPKEIGVPVGQGRDLMVSNQQGLREDGFEVSMLKLCRWFGVARRTVYCRPTKAPPAVKAALAEHIKALIGGESSFGYRTVAGLLGMSKNTAQRIFQLKGWQVRKRDVGRRPRIQALPSVAQRPDERWATDLCRIWGGRDGWLTLALVIDCHTRQVLGWQRSRDLRCRGSGAGVDQPLRHARPRPPTVPAALGQRTGVHQPALHAAGLQLRLESGLHHAALLATERHGRARHSHVEGAVRTPPPLRNPAACNASDRRLDPVLQPPAPSPSAGDEDTR